MFWDFVKNLFSFTGITDITVWQDVTISAIFIPIALGVGAFIRDQWNKHRPAKSLLNGFLGKKETVLVFHSQMSGADDQWNFNPNQKYITVYPDPLPTDSHHQSIQKKHRIDPVLSRAEAHCIADIYSILGQCGKISSIVTADLIHDWGRWSAPTFSVGFNPKTDKLIENSDPIYFARTNNNSGMEIVDIKKKISYDCTLPNDAGVIQKTFLKQSKTPIFLLAGIGTAGTEATGYILSKHLSELGKLYGNRPFCAFIKVNTTEGKESAYIDKIYPQPYIIRFFLYPFVYIRFMRSGKFLKNKSN